MPYKFLIVFLLMLSVVPIQAEQKISVDLSGNYKFTIGDNIEYADLNYDDRQWAEIELPQRFDPHEFTQREGQNDGYIWFRRSFELENIPEVETSLQIREIMNADEVYLNGQRIGATGQFPPDFRSGWSKYRSYSIPGDLLRAGENVIAIRMYFNSEAWIHGPIVIVDESSGKLRELWHDFMLIYLLNALSLLLLFIALFFIIFYYKRRTEVSYLYFALASIATSIAIGLQYFEHLYGALPISSNSILKTTQVGLLFMPVFVSFFFQKYTGAGLGPIRIFLSLLIPVLGSLFIIFASNRHDILMYRNYALVGFLIIIGDVIIQSIRMALQGNKKGYTMFLSISPIFLLGTHDILAFGFGIIDSSIPLFIYGFPALVIILSAHLANRFVRSLNQTEELNQTLNTMVDSISRFVPTQFIQHLHKKSILEVNLGDALPGNMTVLFSDIRNFTSLSEQMSPDENFRFLNKYLERMEPSIQLHSGFVDKYIGDAIMALFAGPSDSAVASAIAMRRELKAINQGRNDGGLENIDFGTGLNSGEVIMGTVGSNNRMDTTVIGSTVNLAARLESLTKVYCAPIILSEFSKDLLQNPEVFHIRELDTVQVQGINRAVKIFEVFDADDFEVVEKKASTISLFLDGLKAYREATFATAYAIFEEICYENPADATANIFKERCQFLIHNPPAGEWTGISRV